MTLRAVILPVPGFSSDGTFSIFMVRRAESASTAISWVLRSSPGSAQISSLVRSGPMPARPSAAATLTLAGKPAAPSLARALEHKERFGEAVDGDAVLLQKGRALERARRLAGDHPDFGDLALGRGTHRVEPEQRAGGEHDAGAGLLGPADQVAVHQQGRAAHRDQDSAGLDRAGGDFGEGRLGDAFDDYLGMPGEPGGRDRRDFGRDGGHLAPRPVEVSGRDRGQLEPVDAGGERAGDRQPDRAEPGDRDALDGSAHSAQKTKRAAPFAALIRPAEAPGKWAGRITVSVSV